MQSKTDLTENKREKKDKCPESFYPQISQPDPGSNPTFFKAHNLASGESFGHQPSAGKIVPKSSQAFHQDSLYVQ